jgi:hypothetical protein
VHPLTRANYLASPPLVVVYALAGTVGSSHNHFRFVKESQVLSQKDVIMLLYIYLDFVRCRALIYIFVLFGFLPSGRY